MPIIILCFIMITMFNKFWRFLAVFSIGSVGGGSGGEVEEEGRRWSWLGHWWIAITPIMAGRGLLEVQFGVQLGQPPYGVMAMTKTPPAPHVMTARPHVLKTHLLTHTWEKSFTCETCVKKFSQACNLRRHITDTHWGEILHMWNLFEGLNKFSHAHVLKTHLMTHT